MKYAHHTLRVLILLAVIAGAFFAARQALVPESFGIFDTYTYGYHRGDAAAEQAELLVVYQGSDKCQKCHEEQYTPWAASPHKGLSCETCHGFWQAHINTNKEIVQKDSSVAGCLLCHRKLRARPADFPQVADFAEHVAEQHEGFRQDMLCVECHNPHEATSGE